MQSASATYKESMKNIFRNRGYIKATIGLINAKAQSNIIPYETSDSKLAYYSDAEKTLQGTTVSNVYATCEENFSKVDGSMFFLPKEDDGYELYNNGIVTNKILGTISFEFDSDESYDIKGLTIDFGESYPTQFVIANDSNAHVYENDSRYFSTENIFNDTTRIDIWATSMLNGQDRLRIYKLTCGISNIFTNEEILDFSSSELISPISETIFTYDVTLEVDNQNQYYSPDNPESALAYFEQGQELKIQFGYDTTGNEDIEWLPETTTYLKEWSATEVSTTFKAVDIFEQISSTYYKGKYRKSGITLYDLAVDVLQDAEFDEDEYYIDEYLKDIVVYNPLPAVLHSEALQIIANAGRCIIYQDRQARIHIKSSFVPDMTVSTNGETEYSNSSNVLNVNDKTCYAIYARDVSTVDGKSTFMSKTGDYLETGYVSDSIYLVDDTNEGWSGDTPTLTIELESGFFFYGVYIDFRNVAPQEFVIETYYNDEFVESLTVESPDLNYITNNEFELFDKMVITFTKGYENSRILIDKIMLGDVTDYILERDIDITEYPTATKHNKIKNISITKTSYSESTAESTELSSEDVTVTESNQTHTLYLSNPSYDFTVATEDSDVTVKIIDSSDYFVTVQFGTITEEKEVRLSVSGKEYATSESTYTAQHNSNGEEITWSNPLISTNDQAKGLEEWLATYYLGDVDYQIEWRGDPRVDASDRFYLELRDGTKTLIRSSQNDLSFTGSWSGSMVARREVL